jgi:hypothetical protein
MCCPEPGVPVRLATPLRDQTNNAHGCSPQIAIVPPTIALQNIHN